MNKIMRIAIAVGFLGSVGYAVQADAAVITGVTASASTEFVGGGRGAVNTVNGSGTDFGTGFTSVDPTTMWLNNGAAGYGGAVDAAPQITFNLGGVYNVSAANVYNYNEASFTGRGVQSAQVWAALADMTYFFLGNITLATASGDATTNNAQGVYIGTNAQYIRFQNLTSFVGVEDNFFIGLSEVSFDGVAVPAEVPEPTSLAILGFSLLGLAAARKRATARV